MQQSVTVHPEEYVGGARRVTLPTSSAYSVSAAPYGLLPGPLGNGWVIARYIPVAIHADEDGWYVLSDTVFQVYGDGGTLAAAQRDYIASLIDYYRMVERDALENDASARRELKRVQKYVHPMQ